LLAGAVMFEQLVGQATHVLVAIERMYPGMQTAQALVGGVPTVYVVP